MNSRMPAYWPYRIPGVNWLRHSVLRYLHGQLRQDRGGSIKPPDIFRTLALAEAINKIEDVIENEFGINR